MIHQKNTRSTGTNWQSITLLVQRNIYKTLTHDEVQKSIKRADAVNNLTDVLQAALAWKQEE